MILIRIVIFIFAALLITPSLAEDRRVNNVAVAPDGKHLSFSARVEEKWLLHVLNLNTGKAERLANIHNVQYSDWSPDGRYLAFDCICSPGVAIIFILDMQTGALSNIRTSPEYLMSMGPRWSPDGGKIAFAAFPHSFGSDTWYGDIFVHDLKTGTTTAISKHEEAEEFPVWLDEKTFIIDGTLSGEYRLSFLGIQTGEHSPLSHDNRYMDAWADISPDRKQVVFNRTELGREINLWQPAILDLETGDVRQIDTGLTKAMFPRFSADGRAVYFHGGEPGDYRLYRLNLSDPAARPEKIEIEFVD